MIDETNNAALCIHPLYDVRVNPIAFDDRNMRDEWQNDVYEMGLTVATGQYRSVVDFGCGSGFKLMKYFSGFETVGYELEPALSYLREIYPDRVWRDGYPPRFVGDLFICADVIEHMQDPAELLRRLADSSVRTIVLSTPALEVLAERGESPRLGPPNNESHYREWTTREFCDFVEMYLRVDEHLVSARQGTQIIVASRK